MNQLISIDGVFIRQDQDKFYSLNDLHKAAIAAGKANESQRPSEFLKSKSAQSFVQSVSDAINVASVKTYKGGIFQGTYGHELVAIRYAAWIDSAFEVKVYQIFRDNIATKQISVTDNVNAGISILESSAKLLNLSNSSKLQAYQQLQKFAGLPNLLPSYAVDAPSDFIDGSSRPSFSLTHLLQKYEVSLKTTVAYAILKDLGIVVRNKRKSIKTGEYKEFWSITSYGLMYGKNLTPPNNQRETQPHFYESRFKELLKLMQNTKAA